MDKLTFYRQCIQELLTEYSKVPPINEDIEVQRIFDTENEHYQILNVGWDKHRRIYNCVMHLDIKNGKIWIQRNQTDKLLADELVAMGVPKQDIILGLQPVYAREYTGYGIA
ncbi:XisI protein [Tolypothrix tenuis PCC 7101]|uniref:XisI protein n=1 Tax=Tolypothrix tenuis PCC 7101 TaxID=231146 RepID=A0A1Z4MV35_9CYAN|nr:XisI protein [Aulosira sp. FACHB-113]BAY97281.1 XisI protein [Tolypothrix tenuis PCC 7101]BAZ72210.1 XisI protein [Aulosira laxa NIES-50]